MCAVLVLASGAYLATVASFWTLGWVQVAANLWVANSVIAAALVKPALARLTADPAASIDASVGPRLDMIRWSVRWTIGVIC